MQLLELTKEYDNKINILGGMVDEEDLDEDVLNTDETLMRELINMS